MNRRPRITPHTDAYGCAFKREFGEMRRPIRAHYGLGEREVFDDLVRCLIDDPAVHGALTQAYACEMTADHAMALLIHGVGLSRPEMTAFEASRLVDRLVARLLEASRGDRSRTHGKTARDDSRTARRKLVRSLKPYRR